MDICPINCAMTQETCHFYLFSLGASKLVFRISDKVMFKSGCSATDTNKEIETSFIARLDMIHSNNI